MKLGLFFKLHFNWNNLFNMFFTKKKRYQYLKKIILENRCKRIMEIGTWNGSQAINMIETAKKIYPAIDIEYYGFDLFELLDEKTALEELTKVPPPMKNVKKRLEKTGANIYLFKGDTKETLPKVINDLPKMDLVFIDGGHSIPTIKNDWEQAEKIMDDKTVVIFDDYYHNRNDVGCKKIIEEIDTNLYEVSILPIKDSFKTRWGFLEISFVQVKRRPS